MSELSIFADESGDTGEDSRLYLLSLVFHDQANDISEYCKTYEDKLAQACLPNIPFHMQPLIYREGDYENLGVATRVKLLDAFHAFAVRCPIKYASFVYEKRRFSNFKEQIPARMASDIQNLLERNYPSMLEFDQVKIYYDNGQAEVTQSLHSAFEQTFSRNVPISVSYRAYRLCQIADMVCGFELLRQKFSKEVAVAPHRSDLLFFDSARDLRNRYLKKLDRMRLA